MNSPEWQGNAFSQACCGDSDGEGDDINKIQKKKKNPHTTTRSPQPSRCDEAGSLVE